MFLFLFFFWFFLFFLFFLSLADSLEYVISNKILRETKKNKVFISSCDRIHQNRLKVTCGQDFLTLDCGQFRGWSAWNVENRVLSLHETPRTLVNSSGLNR